MKTALCVRMYIRNSVQRPSQLDERTGWSNWLHYIAIQLATQKKA